jgi:CubicO group peptidase (beta-lactamase class C family)
MHFFPLSLRICSVFLLAALPALQPTFGQRLPAGRNKAWRALVTNHLHALRQQHIVGATVAFVADGKIVAADYYGNSIVRRRCSQSS